MLGSVLVSIYREKVVSMWFGCARHLCSRCGWWESNLRPAPTSLKAWLSRYDISLPWPLGGGAEGPHAARKAGRPREINNLSPKAFLDLVYAERDFWGCLETRICKNNQHGKRQEKLQKDVRVENFQSIPNCSKTSSEIAEKTPQGEHMTSKGKMSVGEKQGCEEKVGLRPLSPASVNHLMDSIVKARKHGILAKGTKEYRFFLKLVTATLEEMHSRSTEKTPAWQNVYQAKFIRLLLQNFSNLKCLAGYDILMNYLPQLYLHFSLNDAVETLAAYSILHPTAVGEKCRTTTPGSEEGKNKSENNHQNTKCELNHKRENNSRGEKHHKFWHQDLPTYIIKKIQSREIHFSQRPTQPCHQKCGKRLKKKDMLEIAAKGLEHDLCLKKNDLLAKIDDKKGTILIPHKVIYKLVYAISKIQPKPIKGKRILELASIHLRHNLAMGSYTGVEVVKILFSFWSFSHYDTHLFRQASKLLQNGGAQDLDEEQLRICKDVYLSMGFRDEELLHMIDEFRQDYADALAVQSPHSMPRRKGFKKKPKRPALTDVLL